MRYPTLLADPPWKYGYSRVGRKYQHGAAAKYPVLSVEEIKAFPVQTIAAKESCLFLWVPVPLIEEGFEVLHSWGFAYKTMIVWHKLGAKGLGYWYRGAVEVCIVGVRGRLAAFHSQQTNIITTAKTGHSKKPTELYELVEASAPVPRIELFARAPRDGWDSWGYDSENTAGFFDLNIMSGNGREG